MNISTRVIISAVCLTLILAQIIAQKSYCDSSMCPKGRKHIGCGHNGSFASICSADAKIQVMSTAMKNAILKKHNTLRNDIAGGKYKKFPRAANMAAMKWNNELAKLAVLNVKQCQMKHDQCRNTVQFKYAGQNLAIMGWTGQSRSVMSVTLQQIQSWFDEYKNTTAKEIRKYGDPANGAVIGHFTQMVKAEAQSIGCAIMRETKKQWIWQLFACNYGMTNILDEEIYVSAKIAASKCKSGKDKEFKNLCSRNERYKLN